MPGAPTPLRKQARRLDRLAAAEATFDPLPVTIEVAREWGIVVRLSRVSSCSRAMVAERCTCTSRVRSTPGTVTAIASLMASWSRLLVERSTGDIHHVSTSARPASVRL